MKSVKTHLDRVIGDEVLTFGEFYTVSTHTVLNLMPFHPLNDYTSSILVVDLLWFGKTLSCSSSSTIILQ